MPINTAPLYPGHFYHVYNRANGQELLFRSDGNYGFFLEKYFHYIQPLANTYCYCLMSTHFHFLIKVKEVDELALHFGKPDSQDHLDDYLSKKISSQFSHLFNGYTQAFNKEQKRNGSLFSRPFKRKKVTNEDYLKKLVLYIHLNPIEAGICANPKEYLYSSYTSILQNSSNHLKVDAVIDLFGDSENFRFCHSEPPKITGMQ